MLRKIILIRPYQQQIYTRVDEQSQVKVKSGATPDFHYLPIKAHKLIK